MLASIWRPLHTVGVDDRWVAWRFAVLNADQRGRIYRRIAVDQATRLCLLIDLSLQGRLVSTPNGIEVDTNPTGVAVADTLLTYIDTGAATVATATRSGPVTVLDVLDTGRRVPSCRRRLDWQSRDRPETRHMPGVGPVVLAGPYSAS